MIYGQLLTRLVGLPLLSTRELSAVSGHPEEEVHPALARLRDAGWLYDHESAQALPGAGPLVAVSPAGLEQLRRAPDVSPFDLGILPPWQLQPRALPAAIIGEPVTQVVNAAVAATAEAIRSVDGGALAMAFHRPVSASGGTLPGDSRRALRWDHVEVRLEVNALRADFSFLADRALLPTASRGARVQRWRRYVTDGGPEGAATLLILCPDQFERDRWLALGGQADLGGLPVALALQMDVCTGYGADDAIWHVPGVGPQSLLDVLEWAERSPGTPSPVPARVTEPADPPKVADPDEAPRRLRHTNAASSPDEVAAARFLALSPRQRRSMQLLTLQPQLSATDLARVVDVDPAEVSPDLEAMRAQDVIASAHADDGEWRSVIAEMGVRLVAAQAGDARAWQNFQTNMKLPKVPRGQAPSANEHEAGVARVLGLVAAAARRLGLRLADWRREEWWEAEISEAKPVPDASFVLRGAGDRRVVLLEYERIRGGHQARDKVQGWTDWLEGRWRELEGTPLATPGEPPIVAILYDGASKRTRSLEQAMDRAPRGIPLYAISEKAFGRDGFGSSCWLLSGGGFGAPFAIGGAGAGEGGP